MEIVKHFSWDLRNFIFSRQSGHAKLIHEPPHREFNSIINRSWQKAQRCKSRMKLSFITVLIHHKQTQTRNFHFFPFIIFNWIMQKKTFCLVIPATISFRHQQIAENAEHIKIHEENTKITNSNSKTWNNSKNFKYEKTWKVLLYENSWKTFHKKNKQKNHWKHFRLFFMFSAQF